MKYFHEVIDMLNIKYCHYQNKVVTCDRLLNRLKEKNIKITSINKVYINDSNKSRLYQINRNTILKVSDDYFELQACKKIMNNPFPDIVHIKDVFILKVSNKIKKYIILQEKLNDPYPSWFDWTMESWFEESHDITEKYVLELIQDYGFDPKDKKVQWLMRIAKYFDKHGIKWLDLHGGNIMRKGRNHILIDLGSSDISRDQEKIDVVSS